MTYGKAGAPLLFALAASALVACGGCNKKPPSADDDPAATTASAKSVGIPECDAYLKQYERCLHASKAPMANGELAFKAQRESFRVAASTPEGKSSLPGQCKELQAKLAESPICRH